MSPGVTWWRRSLSIAFAALVLACPLLAAPLASKKAARDPVRIIKPFDPYGDEPTEFPSPNRQPAPAASPPAKADPGPGRPAAAAPAGNGTSPTKRPRKPVPVDPPVEPLAPPAKPPRIAVTKSKVKPTPVALVPVAKQPIPVALVPAAKQPIPVAVLPVVRSPTLIAAREAVLKRIFALNQPPSPRGDGVPLIALLPQAKVLRDAALLERRESSSRSRRDRLATAMARGAGHLVRIDARRDLARASHLLPPRTCTPAALALIELVHRQRDAVRQQIAIAVRETAAGQVQRLVRASASRAPARSSRGIPGASFLLNARSLRDRGIQSRQVITIVTASSPAAPPPAPPSDEIQGPDPLTGDEPPRGPTPEAQPPLELVDEPAAPDWKGSEDPARWGDSLVD